MLVSSTTKLGSWLVTESYGYCTENDSEDSGAVTHRCEETYDLNPWPEPLQSCPTYPVVSVYPF